MLHDAVRRAAEALRLWDERPAHSDRLPPASPPMITARALRRMPAHVLTADQRPLPPLAARLSFDSRDIMSLDVDAIGALAERSVVLLEPRKTKQLPPENIRAGWLLEARADSFPTLAGANTDTLARLVRGFLKRASDIGANSFGLPDLASGAVGTAAYRIARVAVRETKAWCAISARPGLIVINVRDPALMPVYRDFIAAAAA